MMASFALGMLIYLHQLWFLTVSKVVPDPHLDEVFHIPQAQAYCLGKWDIWDPKLTTPPGLYLFSSFFSNTLFLNCSVPFLRLQSAVINCLLLPYVVFRICKILRQTDILIVDDVRIRRYAIWTALNISLFPILFFFSALYYTDIASTFWVLVTYLMGLERWFIRSTFYIPPRLRVRDLAIFTSGLISLSFRQTNIIWVAIYPAALEIIRTIKYMTSRGRTGEGSGLTVMSSLSDIITVGWKHGQFYDAPLSDAYLGDYFKTIASLATISLTMIPTITSVLLPYLGLVAAFLVFILWNGGIVLGDKANHVATIHLPQMLYIWPFFAFFSFPFIYPYVFSLFLAPRRLITQFQISLGDASRTRIRPRAFVSLIFLIGSLLAIHFNTIVHPFTLADNRHYTFYIFRRILLRHPLSKYVFAPLYLILGWAVIRSLGGINISGSSGTATVRQPAKAIASQRGPVARGVTVSWVLCWLGATVGVLVTVPLVEPRYLILPWVIWRLQLPQRLLVRTKIWLSLAAETAWFLLVNAVTCYVFLYKGFEWESEKGVVQRFMW